MASVTSYSTKEMSVTNAPGNYGNGEDKHHPIGWNNSTGWRYRSLVRFNTGSGTIPVGAKMVSAILKVKTTSSTQHVAKGSAIRLIIGYLTASFDATIGDGELWKSSGGQTGFPGGVNDKTDMPYDGNHSGGTVYEYDITGIVERITHSGAFKRNGSPCEGKDNYGIEIKSYDENSSSRSTEFQTVRGGYQVRCVITYTTEADPLPPTLEAPLGTLVSVPDIFSFDFPVDDTSIEYAMHVGTTLDGLDLLDLHSATDGMVGNRVDAPYTSQGGAAIPLGQTIYWWAAGANDSGVQGALTRGTFLVNPTPTATLDSPVNGGLIHIHNMGEAVEWDDTLKYCKARMNVAYTHPTGLASETWEVRLDSGATESVALIVADGAKATLDLTTALARDASHTYEVRVLSGGVWSEWTALITARMNWSQAIWNVPDTAGAGSLVTKHDALAGGIFTQIAYLYRGAEGVWKQNISNVTPHATTGIDVLIRLSSADTSQQPALGAWRIEYDTAGDALPDHWEATGATLRLDGGFRRFGVNSLLITPTGVGYARNTQPLVVSPETEYTLSNFVHTLGLTLSVPVKMALWDGAGNVIPAITEQPEGETVDSVGNGAEDWQRIYQTFVTPPGVTLVFGGLSFGGTDPFSIDSFQLEEGAIASQWAPGGLGPAVVADVGGIAVDGEAGGIFRLKSSLGFVTQLIDHGLVTTKHRAIGEDPRQLGTFWRGPWSASETYERDDLVTDGSWVMVANKQTTERAAPVPIGSEFWQLLETPAWSADGSLKAGAIHMGVNVITPAEGYFSGVRVWPRTDWDTYDVYAVRDPGGTNPELLTFAEGVVPSTNDEWVEVPGIAQTVFPAGREVEFVVVAHKSSAAATSYKVITDHWAANVNAHGWFGTSYATAVDDQNAYGIDIKLQEADTPVDWDVLSTSGGGGGGAGPAGPPGPTGPEGPQGPQGATGPQGTPGNDGADSIVPGPAGDTGPQGDQGLQGIQGVQGDTGLQGETGDTGGIGPQGVPGSDGLDGAKGDTGDQGAQGIQGVAGSDGADSTVPGPQGPTGNQGLKGDQGIQGETGADSVVPGPTGPQGIQGDDGPQGIQGIQGTQGVKGDTGDQGIQGATGADSTVPGPTGPKGDDGADSIVPGPTGPQGDPGTDGADSTVPGPTGPQGDTGDTGSQGPQGIQGPTGNTGSQGIQGDTGLKGDTGATGADSTVPGPTGPKGDIGATGSQGTQGIQGAKGDTGTQGIQGIQGDPGADGADSVVPGPTGPQGVKGDTGDTGATGSQGIQGDAGLTGSTGPQGDQGIQGVQGDKGDKGDQGDIGPAGAVEGWTTDAPNYDFLPISTGGPAIGGWSNYVKAIYLNGAGVLLAGSTREVKGFGSLNLSTDGDTQPINIGPGPVVIAKEVSAPKVTADVVEVVAKCVLVKEAIQSIPNGANTTTAWSAADAEYDPLGMVGTNQLIIPAATYPGLWEVEIVNKWQNNGSGERRLDISHGGTMVNRQVIIATVNTATSSAVKHTKRLTADTTVASTIRQGSGGTLDSNYLMVKATRIAL